jgi:hypothetical protein
MQRKCSLCGGALPLTAQKMFWSAGAASVKATKEGPSIFSHVNVVSFGQPLSALATVGFVPNMHLTYLALGHTLLCALCAKDTRLEVIFKLSTQLPDEPNVVRWLPVD